MSGAEEAQRRPPLLHTQPGILKDIYIAVIVLTRKTSAWGFGAGCIFCSSSRASSAAQI
jgi:hypothetical protein